MVSWGNSGEGKVTAHFLELLLAVLNCWLSCFQEVVKAQEGKVTAHFLELLLAVLRAPLKGEPLKLV